MRFEHGDHTYRGLIEAAAHELYVATENLKMFRYSLGIIDKIPENKLVNAACYQHYAEFLRGLYEYYIAIIQINEYNTRLRNYDWDAKMNEAVQRLLNFYGPLKRQTTEFPTTAPEKFGIHFRQIRNRVSHADYRRMMPELGREEITLANFYSEYNFYCELLIEHPQWTWGGKNFVTNYSWAPVEEFMKTVREKISNAADNSIGIL